MLLRCMDQAIFKRLLTTWHRAVVAAAFRSAKEEPKVQDPVASLHAALLGAFKRTVEPISEMRGRGTGQATQYAFLTIRALIKMIKNQHQKPSSKLKWEKDYLPKLRGLAQDENNSEDLRSVANLYAQFFTAAKKVLGSYLSSPNLSYLAKTLGLLRAIGDLGAQEARRFSRTQEARRIELTYVLQPTERGHLVGFDLFKSVPVGHDKPFFDSYKVRDYHFTFYIEEKGKWVKMVPTAEWSASKLQANQFNLGVSGSFKTSRANRWKSVKVVVATD